MSWTQRTDCQLQLARMTRREFESDNSATGVHLPPVDSRRSGAKTPENLMDCHPPRRYRRRSWESASVAGRHFFFAAVLQRHRRGVRAGLDEVDAEKHDGRRIIVKVRKKRAKKVAKESRDYVDVTETFSATTFRSHLESVSGDDDGWWTRSLRSSP